MVLWAAHFRLCSVGQVRALGCAGSNVNPYSIWEEATVLHRNHLQPQCQFSEGIHSLLGTTSQGGRDTGCTYQLLTPYTYTKCEHCQTRSPPILGRALGCVGLRVCTEA